MAGTVVSWTESREEQWWNWTDCRIANCELSSLQSQWWAEQRVGTSSGVTEQIAELQTVSWSDGRHSGELNREQGRAPLELNRLQNYNLWADQMAGTVVSWTVSRDEQWWNWTDCRIANCELIRWQAQWWAEQGEGTSSGETEQIAELQSVSWADGRHSGELNREKGRAAEQRTGTVRRQYIGGRICRWKPSILGSRIIEHPAIGRRRCYHPVNFIQVDFSS